MLRFGVAATVLLALSMAMPAHAEQQNRGLFVAPVREYIAVQPGASTTKQLTIANNTVSPLEINFSVEQFTVRDYTYDFVFSPNKEDWVKLGVTHITLLPGKSYALTYTISPPADATPGGHYFTVLATTSPGSGDIKNKVQAATTIYVTVQGALQVSTSIVQASVPRVLFGGELNFTLDVKDTGNTHFFVYVSGQLEGLTARGKGPETTHLLMPDTVRKVGSSIPAPILPGVYTAAYGYTTDAGETIQRTQRIVYLPVWSLCVVAGLVWLAVRLLLRRRRRWLLAARHGDIRHG
jgi:hypothetical protein